jgi:hypothetical protein
MIGVITAPSELKACAVFRRHGATRRQRRHAGVDLEKHWPQQEERRQEHDTRRGGRMNSAAPIAHTTRPVTMPGDAERPPRRPVGQEHRQRRCLDDAD